MYVETYSKQINIEALAAIDMVKKQFLPAAIEYATFLADSVSSMKAVAVPAPAQEDLLKKLGGLLKAAYKGVTTLEGAVAKAQETADAVKQAEAYRDKVVAGMVALRADVDAMEQIVPRDMWPVPTYTDLLFKL